ncbi:MAG: outer membrane beta-barrel protein [Sandarakinorhabdus sp.]|nr:outer membrane beta-barrel protein [Sandarakinorhabdus sp.]
MAMVSVPAFAVPSFSVPSTAGDDESIIDAPPSALNLPGIGGYSLNASLRTLYDSNMLRLGDGLTPRPGRQKADFRFSPSVSGEIGVPIGRQNVFFSGTLGRDYFLHNTGLDRNRYQLSGGVNLVAGTRCSATGNVTYGSRQLLNSDLAEFTPSVRKSLLYGASANCRSAAGISFGGNVRRSEFRNSDASRSSLDLNSTAYGLNVGYGMGGLGRFELSGNVSRVSYINRSILLPDGTSDTDGVKLMSGRIGYQRELGTRMSLTAGLSYFTTKPDPQTILQPIGFTLPPDPPGVIVAPVTRPSRSGLGYDMQIAYHPSQRLAATFAARRSASASPNVGAQSTVSTSFLADIDYKLGSGISLSTGASYGKHEYQNAVIDAPDRFRRRIGDNISRVYGSVRYSRRLLSVGAEVSYQKRKSNPDDFSFSSVSGSLNMILRFGRNS